MGVSPAAVQLPALTAALAIAAAALLAIYRTTDVYRAHRRRTKEPDPDIAERLRKAYADFSSENYTPPAFDIPHHPYRLPQHGRLCPDCGAGCHNPIHSEPYPEVFSRRTTRRKDP